MKKILFVSTISSVIHASLYRALETFGFEVCFIDFREHPLTKVGHLVHRVISKFPNSIREYLNDYANRSMSRLVLEQARALKPDFIFFSKAKNIDIDVLDELRRIAPTINWYPDTMDNWESIKRISPHYDYFFCYDRFVTERLRKELKLSNVHHLPLAADLDRDAPWPDQERPYPVSFLGSYHPKRYPERPLFLGSIKSFGLHLWGNKAWLDTLLAPDYLGPVSSNLASVMDVYRKSKIVIHIDLMADIVAGTGVTLRPFDVTASGALLIAHSGRAELSELFEPWKEFIPFATSSELHDAVEYYLSHDNERMQIAKAGFERARREHTYLNRITTIFNTVQWNNSSAKNSK